MKKVLVNYVTLLREQSGIDHETVLTEAVDAAALFMELKKRHAFRFGCGIFQVIVNEESVSISTELKDGDTVTFIPPLSGG